VILYLDTSAFLKLYVAEPESPRMREADDRAEFACTHLLAYAEMRAGLAKAVRERRIPADDLPPLVEAFEADWAKLEIVGATEGLIRRAGDLAPRFGLRGYDSVHLAAAEAVWRALPGVDYRVAVFDGRLAEAARGLGMTVLN
jgi:predicted nucleic acid-binding protein